MENDVPNHLIDEKSPYLQQHAHNPVDWYPWGPDALTRARTEDKPILLSIGYSTCHWCHVMERESFSDETIAELMNRHFICIKVDREERPDLDKIYITAVSAMTGSGGWPLNVFLTPQGHPFYGGTYFPPRARPGAPAWPEVLQRIAEYWADPERQARLVASGTRVTDTLQAHLTWQAGDHPADNTLTENALEHLRSAFDTRNGGFGRAPKFPSPSLLQLFLELARSERRANADQASPSIRDMATCTLHAMARGGIFDTLGGGFHRYATDDAWQVPHFEKMLYDNGQLLSVYAQAYQITGEEAYADVARKTADYVLRDLQHAGGGFYAAEDADSLPANASAPEGKKEGAYYTWRLPEIEEILGKDSAVLVHHSDLRPEGNAHYDPHHEFDGLNIVYQARTLEETAAYFGQRPGTVADVLERCRRKLFTARQQRPHPHRDEKILTAWNGLTISGLAQAYQVLGDDRCLQAARRGADFILDRLYDPARQVLYRSWCQEERKIPGMADDYAFLVQAFLDLYAADFEHHWLKKAIQFTEEATALFYDAARGGFFATRPDHDPGLIMRVKEDTDSVIPSASAVAALNLLRLARLTGREDLQDMAATTIDSGLSRMKAHPEAAPYMLLAQRIHRSPWVQVAVAGEGNHPATRAMIDTTRRRSAYGCALAWVGDARRREQAVRDIPFVKRARPLDGQPAAYVCINRSCREPLTSPSDLDTLLKEAAGRLKAIDS